MGKHNELIGFIKSDPNFPEFFQLHYIIHRQHHIKMLQIWTCHETVREIVNFMRAIANVLMMVAAVTKTSTQMLLTSIALAVNSIFMHAIW